MKKIDEKKLIDVILSVYADDKNKDRLNSFWYAYPRAHKDRNKVCFLAASDILYDYEIWIYGNFGFKFLIVTRNNYYDVERCAVYFEDYASALNFFYKNRFASSEFLSIYNDLLHVDEKIKL